MQLPALIRQLDLSFVQLPSAYLSSIPAGKLPWIPGSIFTALLIESCSLDRRVKEEYSSYLKPC